LNVIRYLYPEAQFEKVHMVGQILDAAILIACEIALDGKRKILGVSISLGKQEVH